MLVNTLIEFLTTIRYFLNGENLILLNFYLLLRKAINEIL